MFNYLTENLPTWIKQVVIGVLMGIVIYSFKLFSPLAYGWADPSSETNSTMYGLKWLESWEF